MEPINPTCQRLRPLAEYAERLPSCRRGKRLNRATLWRWALRGLRGRRLRTVELGGGRMTCDAWVWQFLGSTEHPTSRDAMSEVEHARIAQALGMEADRRIA